MASLVLILARHRSGSHRNDRTVIAERYSRVVHLTIAAKQRPGPTGTVYIESMMQCLYPIVVLTSPYLERQCGWEHTPGPVASCCPVTSAVRSSHGPHMSQ